MSDPLRELSAAIDRMFPLAMSLGLYEESLALLRHMENRLAKADARPWIPPSVDRFFTVPLFLLLRGFGQIASSFGRGYSLVSVFALAGLFVAGTFRGQVGIAIQNASIIASVVVVLLYIFAAPSTYCTSGVNGKHVGAVRDKLALSKVESDSRLELIMRNLKLFEERAKRRIATYRWILGAAWAIYFAPAIARMTGIDSTVAEINRESILAAFGWLLLCFVVFDAYARDVDILFRSLELGCNEQLAAVKKAKDLTGSEHV